MTEERYKDALLVMLAILNLLAFVLQFILVDQINRLTAENQKLADDLRAAISERGVTQ